MAAALIRVVDQACVPVEGAKVLLPLGGELESAWIAKPGAEPGVYELSAKPGDYDLQITGPDVLASRQPVHLVAGQEVDMNVRVLRGRPCTLEIRFTENWWHTSNSSLRILDADGDVVFAERLIQPFANLESPLVRIDRALRPGSYVALVRDFGDEEVREMAQQFVIPENGRSDPVRIRF